MAETKKEKAAAEDNEAASLSWLLGSSEPAEGDHAGQWPAVENYIHELFEIHSSRAGRPETSYYGPLETLMNEIGKTLKPRVRCVMALKNQGAGFPDGGLFTADQLGRAADDVPLLDHVPASGVIEAEGTHADALEEADSEQVRRYWDRYRLVLVTTFRDFVLVGEDAEGNRTKLESYQLADSESDFWADAAHPRKMARDHGERLTEYLRRVLLYRARIQTPEDVARTLASYARDARVRVESRADLPALAAVRVALEEALGIRFEGHKGDHFFRSTLVQTLFYGIFSAWVLWSKQRPQRKNGRFAWREAAWWLNVPMIRALFEEVATPAKLGPLGLVEVLDWTGAALDRVDPDAFFSRFDEGKAVQYFYEPFLQSFDPELRKELGVWYTPPEVVRYMVARVDTVLREDLGIPDGLADPRVNVLDPCCGTGAYLVEVLRHIAATLQAKGEEALLGHDLKRAALDRVFGFEILPAPFVVAHMQLGLLLQQWGAPLSANDRERVGVYLTNALTGWEPPDPGKERVVQLQLAGMPELREERDAARKVKRDVPVLVILGNPPYNGFAGMAVDEERHLTGAYRTTKRAPAPKGQGLNDLYIRFFRMAERRIVESTGKGVVCLISNYSWLDGLSYTGMREHYLEAFDAIWIDCLNGDKFKTGKLTPQGEPDPSVFSTELSPEGIQVGTAISLLMRREAHTEAREVLFRHLWGKTKRARLVETAEQGGQSLYERVTPALELGLPFAPTSVESQYLTWPSLPDLFPAWSPGVKTSRDLDLVDIDQLKLEQRIRSYFDPSLSDEALRKLAPSLMSSSARYNAAATRQYLLSRGARSGHLVRYCYRPFDARYVYWHPETKLLDEKRDTLFAAFREGNLFLASRQRAERGREGTPFYVTRHLPDWHMTRPGSICFPLYLQEFSSQDQRALFEDPSAPGGPERTNLSDAARSYLASLGIPRPEADETTVGLLWMHALAIGHSPSYLSGNSDGIRGDWPRIPLPASAEMLTASAELGRQVAALLDAETAVQGVTTGSLTAAMRTIALILRVGGGALNGAVGDLDVTVGWGHPGKDGITMPGQGRLETRSYTPDEMDALRAAADGMGVSLDQILGILGNETSDVYINPVAYWRNVPSKVWSYTIGGYQVIKKWLSYREKDLLGRGLTPEEVREVRDMARRITALLLLGPRLDANYLAVKESAFHWPRKGVSD